MSDVTVNDIHKHFGNPSATARAINRSRQAVSDWGSEVPEPAANDLLDVPGFPWKKKDLPIRKFRSGPVKGAKK